jgi:excisionase family DNA binding protein
MRDQVKFSIPQVARRLNLTLGYVYQLVYAGRIRAEKVAGRWKIPASEVERLELKRAQ